MATTIIAQALRSEHCTHLNQDWCDCDWCRVVRLADQCAAKHPMGLYGCDGGDQCICSCHSARGTLVTL